MKKVFILLFILVFLLLPTPVEAVVDPLSTNNNRFGIHIMNEYDIPDAANLVNGNGGEWGYVTFVIRADQMDVDYWSNFLFQLKQHKLIPIVRIATTMEKNYWLAPSEEDGQNWAEFLGKLPWPTKNRYVVLFNEPNHAKEWGEEINPTDYAKVARVYWQELKKQSEDFFVLPAAMDAAAPNSKDTMDAYDYWDQMSDYDPGIFNIFDGWNSHSYPNPGFRASVEDSGRTSIAGFKHEVKYLSKYYLPANIPVFITETGWDNTLSEDELAENYKIAYEQVWNNPSVVAVTPFVLGYNSEPFSKFSWKNSETGNFYKFYQEVENMNKVKGEPILNDFKFTPQKIAFIKKPNINWFVDKYDILI